MEFLKTILNIMDFSIETPPLYGWFHIMWIGITVAATVLLCVFYKKDNPDRVRKVVLITALIVIALEIYKQINFSFSVVDGNIEFDYRWHAFPFQFCSTPMYIGLLAGLTKKGKFHDALCAYLATFATFAGLCVMVYPGDVFIETLGIDIQTMICHGSMIVIGVYLLYTGHVKLSHKTILKALSVFGVCLTIATVLNEVAFYSGLLEDHRFNMFFISPHLEGSLPVYSSIQEIVPFPFCLFIYVAAFTLAAYLVLLSAIGVSAIHSRRESILAAVTSFFGKLRYALAVAFDMKKHGGLKIAGTVAVVLLAFLTVVNLVPLPKNEQPNPFVVEEGELPMIAAHKGGGLSNPENTMLAFREAVNTYNVDVIDSDLYITKDGYLVYNKNEYIDENCNVNGDMTLEEVKELCRDEKNRHYIKDMTLEELKQYNFGYYFANSDGEYIYRDITDPAELEKYGLQIATADKLFEELYEENPDLLFVIEIKDREELGIEACEALYETISNYPEYENRVVVGTFHDEVEEKLKTDYPELLRGASSETATAFVVSNYLGVNLFADGDFACLQLPHQYGKVIGISMIDKNIIDKAHERNIAVQYWTVNDEAQMRQLIEMGVDCIMTDDPELLARIIEEYRQKRLNEETYIVATDEEETETGKEENKEEKPNTLC